MHPFIADKSKYIISKIKVDKDLVKYNPYFQKQLRKPKDPWVIDKNSSKSILMYSNQAVQEYSDFETLDPLEIEKLKKKAANNFNIRK